MCALWKTEGIAVGKDTQSFYEDRDPWIRKDGVAFVGHPAFI